jgi:hypothetical protein
MYQHFRKSVSVEVTTSISPLSTEAKNGSTSG